MKILRYKTLTALVLALFLTEACNKPPAYKKSGGGGGQTDDSNPGTIIPATDKGGEAFALACKDNVVKGLRSIRKLSNIEISNTVADVFGLSTGLDTSEFAEDIQKNAGGFDTAMTQANFVDERRLSGYIKFAASVSAKVDIAKLFPCSAQGSACFKTILPSLGALAWRRPLTTEELTNLTSLGTQLIADGSKADEAARALVEALIVSRGFLYRTELGVKNSAGDYDLTDWEAASALSYLVLRRPPDETLRALAAKGSLKDPATIKAQAERLLATANAKSAWSEFADMWLVSTAVESHETQVTEFTAAAKSAMAKESRDFFVNTLFDAKAGTYESLLTADYTIAGSELEWLYNAEPLAGKITFKEEERRGLLGQGAFLASHATAVGSSPVTRGAYVLKKMLCTDFVGAPPSSPIVGASANASGRELRQKSASCSGCHSIIDPVGFSYEKFDQVGRFREKDESGAAIDTANTLTIDGADVSYEGPAGLSAAIAASSQGLECFSRQIFRYGMGRMERAKMSIVGAAAPKFVATKESNLDACYISSVTAAMREANGNLKAGILALVSSPAFLNRAEVKNPVP